MFFDAELTREGQGHMMRSEDERGPIKWVGKKDPTKGMHQK